MKTAIGIGISPKFGHGAGGAAVAALAITNAMPDGLVGDISSFTYAATGGIPPYAWSVQSGSLPSGLTLNTDGTVTGARTTAATAAFTVRCTDDAAEFADLAESVLTSQAPTITNAAPDANLGTAASFTYTATGGTAPYTWSVASGALPSGRSLNTSTGAVTGTYTTAQTATYTIRCTGADALYSDLAESVTVADPTIVARWWRIYPTANNGGGVYGVGYWGLREFVGDNGSEYVVAGWNASSEIGSNPASEAFNLPDTVGWLSSSTIGTQWLEADLGSAKAVREMILRVAQNVDNAGDDSAVVNFTFQYSTDHTNWTIAKTVTGETTWTYGVNKTYSIP